MIGKPVLVTTKHRGVFFGTLTAEKDDGTTVELEGARCAIRFGTSKGFFELARTGPTASSKVGATAPLVRLRDVTSVTLCSEAAAAAWRARA